MFAIAVLNVFCVFVMFYAWAGGTNVWMLVGVNVDAAVVEGPTPWAVVDEDGVATPAEAIRDGADYVVIGRQITRAADPAAEAARVAGEIAEALRAVKCP